MKVYRIIFLLFFLLLIGLTFVVSRFVSNPKEKAVFESKAFSCGAAGMPPAVEGGVASLQNKINSAKDGETIIVPKGTYSGPVFTPLGLGDNIFVSASRGASSTCLIRIDGKNITLKGEGVTNTVFYGDGHSPTGADKEPYKSRGGICIVNNAKVTLDNLRVKEFQKRCVVVYNSSIIVKNSIIEGCDEGGISLLGNSSGLIVNNFLIAFNFGGVMLWQNSQAKIVNNILHDAAVMFFYHPGTNDQARAEIINNVFSGPNRDSVTQVDWWKDQVSKLKTNKLSYNIFERKECDPSVSYCETFPGKLTGDPMYTEPVADMCGIAPWGNFNFRDGSPAVGVGDPTIPGSKTLGWFGGPCTDPSSAICTNFIQNNLPQSFAEPTPTPPEEFNPEPTLEPTEAPNVQPTRSQRNFFDDSKPTSAPIYNNVFPGDQISQEITLSIENKSNNKIFRIKGLVLNNAYIAINKEILTKSSIENDISDICQQLTNKINGGIFYASSEDNNQTLRFKNLSMDCRKNQVISIE